MMSCATFFVDLTVVLFSVTCFDFQKTIIRCVFLDYFGGVVSYEG